MGTSVWAFVGNIPGRASDSLIRELLSTCGPIDEWKRAPAINGKSSFGHCRFSTPDAAMRALRLLNELDLSGKKLNVQVDTNARKKLEEYNESNKTGLSSDGREAEDGDMGEVAKKLDNDAKLELDRVVKLYEHELKEPGIDPNLDESSSTSTGLQSNSDFTAKQDRSRRQERKAAEQAAKGIKKEENLSDMELEDDKRNLIHREIGKFRDTYQRYEEEKLSLTPTKAKDDKPRSGTGSSRNRSYRVAGDRPSSKDRDRYSYSSRRSPYEREARPSPYDREPRRSPYYDREPRMSSYERESKRSPYENSRRAAYDRDYKRSPFSSKRQEIYDERHPDEKKFLEVKLQGKELSYQQRLRNWLKRENHKARDFEIRLAQEKDQRILEEQESRRLKEFLEDYNDDRDDIRYYKGSALAKRLADRKKEIEEDDHSRKKEKLELELLSAKCASENNVPSNTSSNVSNINNNRTNDNNISGAKPQQSNSNSSSTLIEHINEDTNSNAAFCVNATFTDAAASTTTPFQLNVTATSSSTNSSASGTSGNKVVTSEEKREQIRELIAKIPATKEELFAYKIDWSLLEDSLMANRIRPWVSKKISEYIGEEEVTLIDFICTKLKDHIDGETILKNVSVVLDEEAEVFVVKMWRLLIYEVEAKRLGISKSSG